MKVELLPIRTALPAQPQKRRHAPREGSWKGYRACLRWDFGFTCPFCMLHEGDLAEYGAEGERVVWIEHFQLRKVEPDLADVYENCLLSCAYCNDDRGSKPNTDVHGRSLLDPTTVAWAEHFIWEDHKLRPKPGDADAEYTYTAYKLDNPRKLGRHSMRPKLIRTHQMLLQDLARLIGKRQRQAQAAWRAGDLPKALERLEQARERQLAFDTLAEQMRRFSAVPNDCPTRCRCGDHADLTLPSWLARQTVTTHLPEASAL